MDLKIEREWRQTLQNDLGREKEAVAQLSTEALQINGLKKVQRETKVPCNIFINGFVCVKWQRIIRCPVFPKEFHRLQDENFQLKTICEDQEQALEELGFKLSEYVC